MRRVRWRVWIDELFVVVMPACRYILALPESGLEKIIAETGRATLGGGGVPISS